MLTGASETMEGMVASVTTACGSETFGFRPRFGETVSIVSSSAFAALDTLVRGFAAVVFVAFVLAETTLTVSTSSIDVSCGTTLRGRPLFLGASSDISMLLSI